MSFVFALKERDRSSSWRASDYFVDRRMIIGVVLGEWDMRIMRLLFENKIVSREQIGNRFFPNVSKDTVNRRLHKLVDISLIKKTTAYVGRGAISGYSLTQHGLAKITPTLPYAVKTKATRSECPLHDIALNDIRGAFEAKPTVQGYYTENVLQTSIDFKDDEWFQPFIELNSDAMAEVDSKVGMLHLSIRFAHGKAFCRFLAPEFDLTYKSHRRYRRKLNAYYGQRKIDGVLYVCADEYILCTLRKLDSEAAERHHSEHQLYLALLDDVTGAVGEVDFTNANNGIFCVR